MADLTFADSHNMVAYLEKSEDNNDFQFWSNAKIKIVNNETQIRAKVDGKTIVITESSMRRDLQFNDVDGITCLTNTEIFENLQLMGYEKLSDKLTFYKSFFSPQWKYLIHTVLQCLCSKSTAWNEFGTNIASAVICLAKKQKFNFSKLIFDGILRNLDPNSKKFLMYPRFLQLFLNNQIENFTAVFNDEYDTPSHTKKVFANMKRQGKDFSRTVTPLFATMLIQSQAMEGEGLGPPTESQHTPTTALPSHSSGPTTLVADETLHEKRGDSVERATTTATSLDTEQGSGGSPGCQDTIGDRPAQTRFERLSKQSNKPPLSRVNTLGSEEDSMKLQELMDLCTKLSDKVLDLENVNNAQALEIQKLKKREDTSKQERNKIDQDEGISWFQEDSETQGRYGHDIGVNTATTSITTTSINMTTVEPVTTASAPITTANVSVSTAKPSTPPTTTTTTTTPIEDEDLTIAQTLMKMKNKGKAKEPEKPVKVKGKDQIEYNVDVAQRLQAELDEEARLEREREEEASKAANIAEWDDVQAMMDADYELAAKLQAKSKERYPLKKEEELDQKSSKRQKTGESSELAEELRDKESDELSQEELQQMMIIVPEQGMNVEALQTKYLIIDWEIYTEGTRKYWKIIRVGNHTEVHHFIDDMLKAFDRDDLVMLWSLVKEKFNSTEPTDDKEREIWVELKRLFEPDIDDKEGNRHLHAGREGVSIVNGNLTLMLVAKLLVDQVNEMSRELLRKIFMQAERPKR
ncbi:hypothetical protein Tco_0168497 [Tanacetum coccineum]